MSIDFDRYIEERASNYAPRPWLFEKIAHWIEQPGTSRYLLLTGQPGGGKTALAAQICSISRGRIHPVSSVIPRDSIAAHHFCFAKDAAWVDPLLFGQSIAAQLATIIPDFAAARGATRPEMDHVTAHGSVTANQITGGQVKGVEINIHAGSPQAAFLHSVRRPLEEIYRRGYDRDIIVLVDALDEAKLVESGPTILDLISRLRESLPRVRFLVTSRNEVEVIRTLKDQDERLVHLDLDVGDARRHSRSDVHRYIAAQLKDSPGLSDLASTMTIQRLQDELTRKADGNFLWAKMALATLASPSEQVDQALLDSLPSDLSPLYLEFLGRLARKHTLKWRSEHVRVLSLLVVAREAMTAEQLATYTQLSVGTVLNVVSQLRQLLSVQSHASPRYSLYHRSLADFLCDRSDAQEFYVDEHAEHERIIAVVLRQITTASGKRSWSRSDEYARSHLAAHLFALRASKSMRALLFTLATQRWLQVKASEASFATDIALIAEAATAPEDEIHRVRARLILATLRSRAHALPTEALILLLRLGEVQRGKSYFSLLSDTRAKLDAACDIARRLPPSDAALAEEFLQAALDLPTSEMRTRRYPRLLRMKLLATLGRFDELLPLVSTVDDHEIATGIAEAAADADRFDVLAAMHDAAVFPEHVAQIAVESALERGDVEQALSWTQRMGHVARESRKRVLRAVRASDVQAAMNYVLDSGPSWSRQEDLAVLLADAVLESNEARERLLALVPADQDLESLIVATARTLARGGGFNHAVQLSPESLVVRDEALREYVVHLVEAGRLQEADTLLVENASGQVHFAFLEALGRTQHIDAPQFAQKFLDRWAASHNPENAIDVIWQARGPDFTLEVLRIIQIGAGERVLRRAVTLFVLNGRSQSVAALAERVRHGLSAQVLNCLCEALLSRNEVDHAVAMAEGVAGKLDVEISARLMAALLTAHRFDAATAFAMQASMSEHRIAVMKLALTHAAPSSDHTQLITVAREVTRSTRVVLRALVMLAYRERFAAAMNLDHAFANSAHGGPYLAVYAALELYAAGHETQARLLLQIASSVDRYKALAHRSKSERPEHFVMRELLRMRAYPEANIWIERGPVGLRSSLLVAMLAEQRASPGDQQMVESMLERWLKPDCDAVDPERAEVLARCAVALHATGDEAGARVVLQRAESIAGKSQSLIYLAQATIDPSRAAIEKIDAPAVLIEIAERNFGEVSVAALRRAILHAQSLRSNDRQRLVLAALRIVSVSEAAHLLVPLDGHLDIPELLHASALQQCLEPMLALINKLHPGRAWAPGTFAHVLSALVELHLWPQALRVARLADNATDLRSILQRAAHWKQLDKVVELARELGVPYVQEILRQLADDAPSHIRIQATELLALDATELRAAWALQLCDCGAAASAFKAAGSIRDDHIRRRAMKDVLVLAACRDLLYTQWDELWGDEKKHFSVETARVVADAAGELLGLDQPRAVARLTLGMSDHDYYKHTIPAELALRGHVTMALELAEGFSGSARDNALTRLALAAAKTRPGQALQMVAKASAKHQAKMMAWVLSESVGAGHYDFVLRAIGEPTVLDERGLSILALRFFEADRPEDARQLLGRALSTIEGNGADWERNVLLNVLARAAAARNDSALAQSLVDMIPRTDTWFAIAVEGVTNDFGDFADSRVVRDFIEPRLSAIRLVNDFADTEAKLMMRLLASGSIRTLKDAVRQIRQAKRGHTTASMVLVELSRSIHPSNVPQRWQWLPGARAINSWRSRARARGLLRFALVEIRSMRDWNLSMQLESSVCVRYAELQFPDIARRLAHPVQQAAERWPKSVGRVVALTNVGLVDLATGLPERATQLAMKAIESIPAKERGDMYRARELLGELIGRLELRYELVSRLISLARDAERNDHGVYLRILSTAARRAPANAGELGTHLAAAAATAEGSFLSDLFGCLVECARLGSRTDLLTKADSLLPRLTYEVHGTLAQAAREVTRMAPDLAKRWLTVALDTPIPEYSRRSEDFSGIARAFQGIGDANLAERCFELAFRHSLEESHSSFHWVLSQLIGSRSADDPLVVALPQVLADIESWWAPPATIAHPSPRRSPTEYL